MEQVEGGASGPKEGRSASQEIHCSQADQCNYAEGIVGNDEGEQGGEEESSLERFAQTVRVPVTGIGGASRHPAKRRPAEPAPWMRKKVLHVLIGDAQDIETVERWRCLPRVGPPAGRVNALGPRDRDFRHSPFDADRRNSFGRDFALKGDGLEDPLGDRLAMWSERIGKRKAINALVITVLNEFCNLQGLSSVDYLIRPTAESLPFVVRWTPRKPEATAAVDSEVVNGQPRRTPETNAGEFGSSTSHVPQA